MKTQTVAAILTAAFTLAACSPMKTLRRWNNVESDGSSRQEQAAAPKGKETPAPSPDAVPQSRKKGATAESAKTGPILSKGTLDRLGLKVDWQERILEGRKIRRIELLGRKELPTDLYVQTDNFEVHAVDRKTGTYRWINQRIGFPLEGDLSQTDSNLYLLANDTLFVVDIRVNPRTGRASGELRYKLPLGFAPRTAAASNDRYVAVGDWNGAIHSIPVHLIETAIEKGEPLPLSKSLEAWHSRTGGEVIGNPVVPAQLADEGAQYPDLVIYTSTDGKVRARSLANFQDRNNPGWDFPREGTAGALRASPFWHKRWLFFGSDDHHLYILNTEGYYQGTIVLGGRITSQPVVVGSDPEEFNIYVHAERDGFYCLDIDEVDWVRHRTVGGGQLEGGRDTVLRTERRWPLSVRWKVEGPDRFLVEGDRRVYLLDSKTNTLFSYDKKTGEEQWRWTVTDAEFFLTDTTAPYGIPAADLEEGILPNPSRPQEWRVMPGSHRLIVATKDGRIAALQEK